MTTALAVVAFVAVLALLRTRAPRSRCIMCKNRGPVGRWHGCGDGESRRFP